MRAQMSFFRNKTAARGAGLALAVGLASSFSMSARAFEVSEAQKEACTPDAFRLCGAYIPDSDRVAACMQANVANLSPRARRSFSRRNLSCKQSQRSAIASARLRPAMTADIITIAGMTTSAALGPGINWVRD